MTSDPIAPRANVKDDSLSGVDAVSARSRHLTLEGGVNFRDLGGHIGANGRVVKWGQVFRSSELTGLTSADLSRLDGLELDVLFDLRADSERSTRHCQVSTAAMQKLVSREHAVSGADLRAIVGDPAVSAENIAAGMALTYRQLPYEQAESIRTVFELLATGRTPLLFFCAAGKDRTGVVSALILEALGVNREQIVAEYEMTNLNREVIRRRFLVDGRRAGVDVAVWEPLIRADRTYLLAMFDELDRRHGGVPNYLREHLKLASLTVQAIRDQLLSETT